MLSAVFGVTNRLLDCVRFAERGDRTSLQRARAQLLDGHVAMLRQLVPDPAAAARVADNIHAQLAASVDEVCRDVLGSGVASAYQRDVASSVGERWSTKMVR